MVKAQEPGDGIVTGRLRRAAPLAGLAARTAGEAVIASLRRRPADADAYERRAERYAEVMGRSKGAFMKIGQIMSYVPFGSAVPPENRAIYQAAMSRLQADAPPMAPELAAEVIESELGAPPGQLFSEFSAHPVAAASIGQVHTARLPDGQQVAVKVQYPGLAQAIKADLRNTELVAVIFQMLRSVIPGLTRADPKTIAAEVSERISEELDYRIEAAHQSFFAAAYAGHPFIHVPSVIGEYSTARVLTQQLAAGLSWPEAITASQEVKDRWGEALFRFVFGSMRRLLAWNVDPHPGNFLFHPDGSVSFLDFGCVKHHDKDNMAQVQRIVRAVLADDARALRAEFVEVGVFGATTGPAPEEILAWYRPGFEMLTAPQPYTMTPGLVARVIENQVSLRGPGGRVVRSLRLPKDYVFLTRIDLGLWSVLAELRATGYWRSIVAELDEGADPVTDMGKADAAFWAARKLPAS
jgi:predicted unusual protein kinase regulating ubiquinone biosynthesis (AarF/ABC1/UbiB family)